MSWENNPYYHPEKFGLVTVAELEMRERNYDFWIVAVWRHTETGKLYWASDSGCSCPSPFEDYHSLDDLTPLSSESYGELERYVADAQSAGDRIDFLRKVNSALEK